MVLVRDSLRQEKMLELEGQLEEQTEEEIKQELKCYRLLERAYQPLIHPDSWFSVLRPYVGGTPEREEKARSSWQKLSKDERAQVMVVFLGNILNPRYVPDVMIFRTLVILAEAGEDSAVLSYSSIEVLVECIKNLEKNLEVTKKWMDKTSNHLLGRLAEHESSSEANELIDKCLVVFNFRFIGVAGLFQEKLPILRSCFIEGKQKFFLFWQSIYQKYRGR